MEKAFQYISSLNPDIFIALILAFLFTLEQVFSAGKSLLKRTPHLLTSVLLQVGYVLLNYGLATLVVKSLDWTDANKFGLFNVIHVPYYLKVILGVLGIDLVNYWAHRIYHTSGLLWRLHRVHHSDNNMDSATTYRFHPLDAVLDNVAGVAAALIFGLDGAILIFWLILYMPLLVLHHADFMMPKWFDNSFGKIIVSPNFHKIHHHQEQKFTDSNYGLMFIFWDKFFGTYQKLPVSEIKYGLKEFDKPSRQSVWFLLKSPFINVKK